MHTLYDNLFDSQVFNDLLQMDQMVAGEYNNVGQIHIYNFLFSVTLNFSLYTVCVFICVA